MSKLVELMAESIPTVAFRPDVPLGIELVPMSRIVHQHKASATQPHRNDFYSIAWFTQGTAVHTVDFKPVPVRANTLLFLAKRRVHVYDPLGTYDGVVLIFTDAFFSGSSADRQLVSDMLLLGRLADPPVLPVSPSQTDLLLTWQQLTSELGHPGDSVHRPLLHNLLQNILFVIQRERRNQGFTGVTTTTDLILRFDDLVDTQFRQLRSVKQYADQLNITERRLQQATVAATGKTPKQLISGRIVLEAKRLLRYTDQSVKEIGFALGFDEPTNFIRFFRQNAQQTPAEFRAAPVN